MDRAVPQKGNSGRLPQGSGNQRGRQGAMRGFGPRVATALHISPRTLEHELEDLSRDPVAKTAARVRALKAAGASPERLYLYVMEVLQAIKPAVSAETLTTLLSAESCADADENVVGDRALVAGLQGLARTQHADHLRRQAAASLALADYLDAHPEISL